jgi:hypothetical protein
MTSIDHNWKSEDAWTEYRMDGQLWRFELYPFHPRPPDISCDAITLDHAEIRRTTSLIDACGQVCGDVM